MAAHRRKNEGFGAKRLQFTDHALGDGRDVGNAAAAAAERDNLAGLYLGAHFGPLEFPGNRCGNVAQVGAVELLAHVDHARKGNVESARDVDFYFVFDHLLSPQAAW